MYRGKHRGDWKAVVENVKSPADIGYDTKRHRLLIPIFQGNTVIIQPMEEGATTSPASGSASTEPAPVGSSGAGSSAAGSATGSAAAGSAAAGSAAAGSAGSAAAGHAMGGAGSAAK